MAVSVIGAALAVAKVTSEELLATSPRWWQASTYIISETVDLIWCFSSRIFLAPQGRNLLASSMKKKKRSVLCSIVNATWIGLTRAIASIHNLQEHYSLLSSWNKWRRFTWNLSRFYFQQIFSMIVLFTCLSISMVSLFLIFRARNTARQRVSQHLLLKIADSSHSRVLASSCSDSYNPNTARCRHCYPTWRSIKTVTNRYISAIIRVYIQTSLIATYNPSFPLQ